MATQRNAAQAAQDEATASDGSVTVEFRGEKFTISDETLRGAHFRMALASGDDGSVMYEALGPQQAAAWIRLIKRGEEMADVTREFFDAFPKAGPGNS